MEICRKGHVIDRNDNVPRGYACRQCLRDANARNYRRNAGRRPRSHRSTGASSADLRTIRRFFAKIQIGDGCWIWRASLNRAGYGTFASGGRTVMAHRFAFELMVGPIDSENVLDHTCKTPSCVRPDHLEPVSQSENVIRGSGNGLRRPRR